MYELSIPLIEIVMMNVIHTKINKVLSLYPSLWP